MNPTPIATDFVAIAAAMQRTTPAPGDAELIRLCHAFIAADAELRAWCGDEDVPDKLLANYYAALERLTSPPAKSPEGLRIKAEAAYVAIADQSHGWDDGHREELAALSVLRELTGRGMNTPIAPDFAAIAASMKKPPDSPGAELIRRCQQFAEAEIASWYRYVIAPEHLADEQDTPSDMGGYNWIVATPATTPEGLHAKALALSAWDRTRYFDDEPLDSDGTSALLASLLQDVVAPARNAIMARLAAQLGPLPARSSPEGRWLGRPAEDAPDALPETPVAVPPKEAAPGGEERADALWRLLSSMVGVASKQCTAAGYPPLPHQEAQS